MPAAGSVIACKADPALQAFQAALLATLSRPLKNPTLDAV
jgi:hypothetical protein